MWKSNDLDSVYLYPTRRASEIQVRPLTKKVPKSKARPDLLEDKVIAWIPYSTSKEDSSLITAAPDLLEALTELLDQLETIGIPEWSGAEGLSLDQARTAIAKAKGGNHAQKS